MQKSKHCFMIQASHVINFPIMLHSFNPLNIKEPKLYEYYCELDLLFKLNNLEYEADYQEELDANFNSSIGYIVKIPNKSLIQSGFITYVKKTDEFGGAIFKVGKMRHLEMEGFTEEQISEDKILATAKDVEFFFMMLLAPIIDQLKV